MPKRPAPELRPGRTRLTELLLLYESFVESLRKRGIPTETGRFRAMMEVELVNDGPVTLLLDSDRLF